MLTQRSSAPRHRKPSQTPSTRPRCSCARWVANWCPPCRDSMTWPRLPGMTGYYPGYPNNRWFLVENPIESHLEMEWNGWELGGPLFWETIIIWLVVSKCFESLVILWLLLESLGKIWLRLLGWFESTNWFAFFGLKNGWESLLIQTLLAFLNFGWTCMLDCGHSSALTPQWAARASLCETVAMSLQSAKSAT